MVWCGKVGYSRAFYLFFSFQIVETDIKDL